MAKTEEELRNMVEDYLDLSSQFDSELPREEEYTDTVANLEAQFHNLGLKFSIPFNSAFPMRAEGEIQGKKFTFRIRRDIVRFSVFETIEDKLERNVLREAVIKGATGVPMRGMLEPDEAEIVFANAVNSFIWK